MCKIVLYLPLEKQCAAVLQDASGVHEEFTWPHLEGCYFWLGKTWKRDFLLLLAEEDIRVPEHCLLRDPTWRRGLPRPGWQLLTLNCRVASPQSAGNSR